MNASRDAADQQRGYFQKTSSYFVLTLCWQVEFWPKKTWCNSTSCIGRSVSSQTHTQGKSVPWWFSGRRYLSREMLHHWTCAGLLGTMCTWTVLPKNSVLDRIAGASLWSPRPPRAAQHGPLLRTEGGNKCHHVLVSFRKQFRYLKSAYKVLEEGSKKPAA